MRTIRSGHVFGAAFDPDGRILATGGIPGTALWDVESEELRTTLDRGICTDVAFSPRHDILATANEVFGITLWEPSTGAVLHRLAGNGVVHVAFDAEGGMLATGSGCTILLWEIPGGVHLRRLDGHAEDVLAVAFHPGGEILASGSLGRTVRLWDVASGNTVSILEGHTGQVQSLSFPVMAGYSRRRVGTAPYGSGRPRADAVWQSFLCGSLRAIGCPASRFIRICRSWWQSGWTLSLIPSSDCGSSMSTAC